MTYDVGNPGPGLGQAQECGGVETVKWDPNPPLLVARSPTAIYIYKQTIKPAHYSLPLTNTTYYHL